MLFTFHNPKVMYKSLFICTNSFASIVNFITAYFLLCCLYFSLTNLQLERLDTTWVTLNYNILSAFFFLFLKEKLVKYHLLYNTDFLLLFIAIQFNNNGSWVMRKIKNKKIRLGKTINKTGHPSINQLAQKINWISL